MMRARVLTPWVIFVHPLHGNVNRPQIDIDYSLNDCGDVTGQQQVVPVPNVCTVEIVCADAVLTAISSDANYSVLWSESA